MNFPLIRGIARCKIKLSIRTGGRAQRPRQRQQLTAQAFREERAGEGSGRRFDPGADAPGASPFSAPPGARGGGASFGAGLRAALGVPGSASSNATTWSGTPSERRPAQQRATWRRRLCSAGRAGPRSSAFLGQGWRLARETRGNDPQGPRRRRAGPQTNALDLGGWQRRGAPVRLGAGGLEGLRRIIAVPEPAQRSRDSGFVKTRKPPEARRVGRPSSPGRHSSPEPSAASPPLPSPPMRPSQHRREGGESRRRACPGPCLAVERGLGL